MAGLRDLEQQSIRGFVERCADDGLIRGEVLDYGCGRQPYRGIVEDHGGYHPYDRILHPASTVHTDVGADEPLRHSRYWGTILCTQVIQYVPDPWRLVYRFKWALQPGGRLLMTGPTNWPFVETEDLWRFTAAGARKLFGGKGWRDVAVGERAHVEFEGERWPLGWWAVAVA